jgi:hypothetical protein
MLLCCQGIRIQMNRLDLQRLLNRLLSVSIADIMNAITFQREQLHNHRASAVQVSQPSLDLNVGQRAHHSCG